MSRRAARGKTADFPWRAGMRGRVGRAAKQAGLFLLCHEDGCWEFLSATRGVSVLTWFDTDGRWSTPGGKRGAARSPFGALHAAIQVENLPGAGHAGIAR